MYEDGIEGYSLRCETILLEEYVEMEGHVQSVFARCNE